MEILAFFTLAIVSIGVAMLMRDRVLWAPILAKRHQVHHALIPPVYDYYQMHRDISGNLESNRDFEHYLSTMLEDK